MEETSQEVREREGETDRQRQRSRTEIKGKFVKIFSINIPSLKSFYNFSVIHNLRLNQGEAM
jgi:hypothetical protein